MWTDFYCDTQRNYCGNVAPVPTECSTHIVCKRTFGLGARGGFPLRDSARRTNPLGGRRAVPPLEGVRGVDGTFMRAGGSHRQPELCTRQAGYICRNNKAPTAPMTIEPWCDSVHLAAALRIELCRSLSIWFFSLLSKNCSAKRYRASPVCLAQAADAS
jgi:hypothetical protein